MAELFPGHGSFAGEFANHQREQKLEGINIKENDKEQRGVQQDRVTGLQSVAARKDVMPVPDLNQRAKTDREGHKAFHGYHQLFECARHFQRHHQQRHGKGKNGIGKAFQPGDFSAAPAEMRFRGNKAMCLNDDETYGGYCAIAC